MKPILTTTMNIDLSKHGSPCELVAIEELAYPRFCGGMGEIEITTLYWMRKIAPEGIIDNDFNREYYSKLICYSSLDYMWNIAERQYERKSLKELLDSTSSLNNLITDPKEINKILMTKELLK